jgi:hypothetical protein
LVKNFDGVFEGENCSHLKTHSLLKYEVVSLRNSLLLVRCFLPHQR